MVVASNNIKIVQAQPVGRPVRVFLYTEVANFRSEPTATGRLRTLLSQSVEIFDSAGKVIWQRTEPEIEDIVVSPRRDFFIPFPVTLPAALLAAVALLAATFNPSGNESPGAMDNASGIAVLLEAARSLPGEATLAGVELVFLATGAEEIGLELADIRVISADSDLCPVDLGAYSSRITLMVGNLVRGL